MKKLNSKEKSIIIVVVIIFVVIVVTVGSLANDGTLLHTNKVALPSDSVVQSVIGSPLIRVYNETGYAGQTYLSLGSPNNITSAFYHSSSTDQWTIGVSITSAMFNTPQNASQMYSSYWKYFITQVAVVSSLGPGYQASLNNYTYRGFTYFVETQSGQNLGGYFGLGGYGETIMGHSGQYYFEILYTGTINVNPSAVAQAEINAMT